MPDSWKMWNRLAWPNTLVPEIRHLLAGVTLCVTLMTIAIFGHLFLEIREISTMKRTDDAPSDTADLANVTAVSERWTPGGQSTADELLEAIDVSVDPCDDMFGFVCTNWIKKRPIPGNASSVSHVSLARDYRDSVLRDVLDSPITEGDGSAFTKAKVFYRSCIDEGTIESRGTAPVLTILKQIGPWPVIDNDFDEDKFQMTNVLIALAKYKTFPFSNMKPGQDDRNNTRILLELHTPEMNMKPEYYVEPAYSHVLQDYGKLCVEVIQMLGAPTKTLDKDVQKMIDFEVELARIIVATGSKAATYDSVYNVLTVSELYLNVSSTFDWYDYIDGILSQPGVDIFIDWTEPVYIPNLEYYVDVQRLIEKTHKRTIANYVMWRFVFQSLVALPRRYADKMRQFLVNFGYPLVPRERWLDCAYVTLLLMPNVAARLYVDRKFNDASKQMALEMVSYLKDAVRDLIDARYMMSHETKIEAKIKLDGLDALIGYPDWIQNMTSLDETFESYAMNVTTMYENWLETQRKRTVDMFSLLRQPIDNNRWHVSAAEVNAFYDREKNHIVFPAAKLQKPFFSHDYPNYINYARIGAVIGHEITHGFDRLGRHFDEDGVLRNWWSDISDMFYSISSGCFIRQYRDINDTQVNLMLNGRATASENIADSGGLKAAFNAYRNWYVVHGRNEAVSPGLNYTIDQLFFMNYAYMRCSHETDSELKYMIKHGIHAPKKYRVNAVLQNNRDFAEAFNCPKDSFMNPSLKCSLW